MTQFLDGMAVQFYRGIGPEVQYIQPFSRMNFFIGPNNAGKSIVLNLLASQFAPISVGKARPSLEGPEQYRGRETGQFLIAIGRQATAVSDSILLKLGSEDFRDDVDTICKNLSQYDHIWAVPKVGGPVLFYPGFDPDGAMDWTKKWDQIWSRLTRQNGGAAQQHWIPETVAQVANNVVQKFPSVFLIPAKRTLSGSGEAFEDLSGRGLIDHLATLQNPAWDKQADRETFQKINKFLQDVTGKSEATLEVPSGREHLLVHMDNKVLPLSSLGTGIHEVVLIAAFCTIHDKCIMCIEEPEIHLHPLLQKKLVNYLHVYTESQYFVATHSSVFIDTPGSNIFHVVNDGEQTRIKAALTREGQRNILDDLGYHASDILQSNAVVWVEGPSDRIYLNHWISDACNDLKEGIHYTVMFYGGSLIRHLTASDAALQEFIKLRDLNRNIAILLDSDRDSAEAPLKPHAQRLVDEMRDGGGLAWVTAGREVENYIDGATLQAALKQSHPRIYKGPKTTGQYDHAFYFWREDPQDPAVRKTFKDADKVGAATIVCEKDADLDKFDLRERVEELIGMIRRANGL